MTSSVETAPANSSVAPEAMVAVTPLPIWLAPLAGSSFKVPPLTIRCVPAGSAGGVVISNMPAPSSVSAECVGPMETGPPSVKWLPAAIVNVVPPVSARTRLAVIACWPDFTFTFAPTPLLFRVSSCPATPSVASV